MPKIEHLVPDWKPRLAGETVWFGTPKHFDGQAKMIAALVVPDRAFVMVMARDRQKLQNGSRAQEGIWSFTLIPLDGGQTRLIARLRGGNSPSLTSRLAGRLFWEPAHFVMEQKMLRTIRDLAEHS